MDSQKKLSPARKLALVVLCLAMLLLSLTPLTRPPVLAQDEPPPDPDPALDLPEAEQAEPTPGDEEIQPPDEPQPETTPEPLDLPAQPPDEAFSSAADDGTLHPASGTKRYVDAVRGDDSENNCTDKDHPCQTITRAVDQADSDDVINIYPGTYRENITGLEKSLTLQGIDKWINTIIEGNAEDASVIYYANDKERLTLINLTITKGNASGDGGGIFSAGPLEMRYVHVTGNTAGGSGGGIYVSGTNHVYLFNVEVDKNTAGGDGGGIFLNIEPGSFNGLEQVTVAENESLKTNGLGGGLYIKKQGVDTPNFFIKNSTISSNIAADASAVFASEVNLGFQYATVAYNKNAYEEGAAIINDRGTFSFKGTIVAHNEPENCDSKIGTWISDGYNLESDNTCNFDKASDLREVLDPKLDVLAYYDDADDAHDNTRTHALKQDSPAIDKAENPILVPINDQRDRNRTADGDGNGTAMNDIGAFEFFFPADVHINAHDPHPSLPGQEVTVQVMVTSGYPPGATGSVYVWVDGETTDCEITLNEAAEGSCNLTFTSPGEKTIHASYGGDANHDRASNSTIHLEYTLHKVTFRSSANYDGWVLEKSRTSSKGGSLNASSTTIRVGDDAKNRQYRAFLHFSTTSLPDNAVITDVQLQVRRYDYTGTSPFKTHGSLYVDMRKGAFSGKSALQLTDWQASASKSAAGKIGSASDSSRWHTMTLSSSNFKYINKTGVTQLRLRFSKQDNGNKRANYVSFYSGNAGTSSRPKLIITYYIP